MSTFGPTSVGTSYGIAPAVVQTRSVGLGSVPSVGGVLGETPASVNQTSVAAGSGVATTIDQISQDAALVDGAISMPARPLAEIIWQLRASVNAGRGAVRASRAQAGAHDGTQKGTDDAPKPAPLPSDGAIKTAARAYSAVQMLGSRRATGRSVDVYNGKK